MSNTVCQDGMLLSDLGHVIGNGQLKPDPEKLWAVREFLILETKKQISDSLGLTGYYRSRSGLG